MSANKVVLAGVQIDNLDEKAVINHVLSERVAGRGGRIVTPNVDHLRQIYADIDLQSLVSEADLVIADGMPLIWASRILKTPLAERVTGAQLIWSLSGAATDHDVPVFLLGGATGVAERAGVAITNRYPGLKLAGTYCPPFGFEDDNDQMREIVSRIEQTSPGVIFCGLGFPKQERLMAILARRFPDAWLVGCGASLAMAAGDVRRAPKWMQTIGLEWLCRLVQEPRRLFSRYIIHDIPFALQLMFWSARDRRARALQELRVHTGSDRLIGRSGDRVIVSQSTLED
jgi:N-acetylglucosaminyldiphosphoundecaprenol N-acetyl-beta-D-mannosaminyltransferase